MIVNETLCVTMERATVDDIDEIVALENSAYPFPWARNVLLGEINGESFSYVFVARLLSKNGQRGQIIGQHFFWIVADEIHILNIAVAPDFQGRGLGKYLMNFAIDFGKDLGAACVILEVRVSNLAAQRLYRNMGFEQIGLRKKYYGDNKEDAYVMKKKWRDSPT